MSIDAIYQHPRFQVYRRGKSTRGAEVAEWLETQRERLRPVLPGLDVSAGLTFDLSVPDERGMERVEEFTSEIFAAMDEAGATVGIGKYNEDRHCYRSDLFRPTSDGAARTLHIGMDLFVRPGTVIAAPLPGTVHSFQDNANLLDYGPTIILEHEFLQDGAGEGGLKFYTLYGHLSRDSLAGKSEGQRVADGEVFAAVGNYPENGNWPPHLHFQIINDLFDLRGDFPGVVPPAEADLWRSICPDPALILQLQPTDFIK